MPSDLVREKFSCVVDLLGVEEEEESALNRFRQALDPKALKPFGQIEHFVPKDLETDPVTGAPKVRIPRPQSKHEIFMSQKPNFQPDDKINATITMNRYTERPSNIELAITVLAADCPPSMHQNVVESELRVGFSCLASNIRAANGASKFTLSPVYEEVNGADGNPNWEQVKGIQLPSIVVRTHRINEKKGQIRFIDLTLDNRNRKMKQFNLLTSHTWTHEPSRRAVAALTALMDDASEGPITIRLYLRDERQNLGAAFTDLESRFAEDLTTPNVWQRMHTKKLAVKDETVFFNIGNFKDAKTRPAIITHPSSGYHDAMEMMTRQALCAIQVKEFHDAQVKALNVLGGVIRLLSLTGAGDLSYLAVLRLNHQDASIAAELNIRFEAGNVLNVNFRVDPERMVDEDNWKMIIMKAAPWTLQAEIIGQLVRPRVPLGPEPTVAEKTGGRPLVTMKLPVTVYRADTDDEVRKAVGSSTPIHCTLTYSSSVKPEMRIVAAQDILLNGSRPVLPKDKLQVTDPDRKPSSFVRQWSRFLLMKDARVQSTTNFFSSDVSKKFMTDQFTDTDHVAVLDYLSNVPVSCSGISVGVIRGVPGAGKTTFIASLVVSRLLGNPDERVCFLAPANEPVDVFVRKINDALEHARALPEFATLLNHRIAIRVHNDRSETSYVMSMSDQRRLNLLEEIERELEDNNNREGEHQDSTALATQATLPLSSELQGEGSQEITKTVTHVNTMISDDDGSEEEESEEDDLDNPEKKKKKKKGKSKGAKKREALQEARVAHHRTRVEANYTIGDAENAITVDDDAYLGEGNDLICYGGTLEGGVIDLASPDVPRADLAALASLQITKSLNEQLTPAVQGVQDKRFKEFTFGIGQNTLDFAKSFPDDPTSKTLLGNLAAYEKQGSHMSDEDRKELKSAIAAAFVSIKEKAAVQCMTVSNVAHTGNQLSGKVFVVADEVGKLSLNEFGIIAAHLDCSEIVMVGDENQLAPQVEMINPKGSTLEAGKSILQYLLDHHWPSAHLNCQRRSCPGMFKIPSRLAYQGKIADAQCTRLSDNPTMILGDKIRIWLNKKFKKDCKEYFRYLLIESDGEIRDELTGSFFNLCSASVIINLQSEMIRDGVLSASEQTTITHYTAQQRIHDYALAQMNRAEPAFEFTKILNKTTDQFQGGDNALTWGDSVRTLTPGFTADTGRNVVFQTRGKSGFINVVDSFSLKASKENGKVPYMKRAVDESKKFNACIYIERNGEHSHLFTHPSVHARVLGTDANIEGVQSQEATKAEFTQEDVDCGLIDSLPAEPKVDESNEQVKNGDGWGQPTNSENPWDRQFVENPDAPVAVPVTGNLGNPNITSPETAAAVPVTGNLGNPNVTSPETAAAVAITGNWDNPPVTNPEPAAAVAITGNWDNPPVTNPEPAAVAINGNWDNPPATNPEPAAVAITGNWDNPPVTNFEPAAVAITGNWDNPPVTNPESAAVAVGNLDQPESTPTVW